MNQKYTFEKTGMFICGVAICLLTSSLLTSCFERELPQHSTLDAACYSLVQYPAIRIHAPAAALVNELVPVEVVFETGTCNYFSHLDKTGTGFTRDIRVKVNALDQGCTMVCPMGTREQNATYYFSAPQPGTYHVRIMQPDQTILTHTIEVTAAPDQAPIAIVN